MDNNIDYNSNNNLETNYVERKSNKKIIIVLVVLLLIALGVGGYFGYKYFTKEEKKCPDPVKCNDQPTINTEVIVPMFDTNKIVNKEQYSDSYVRISPVSSSNIEYRVIDNKTVYLQVKEEDVSYFEGSNKIDNFSTNILDTFIGSFGSDNNGKIVIFFIMEDGSLEYIPVDYAYKNDKVESYGKVEGINNIIRLYQVEGHENAPTAGWNSVLAPTNDGSLYILSLKDGKVVAINKG